MRTMISAWFLLLALSASAQDANDELAVIQAALKQNLYTTPDTRDGAPEDYGIKLITATSTNIEMSATEFTFFSLDPVVVQFRAEEAIYVMQVSRPAFTEGGKVAMLRIDQLRRDRPRLTAYYRMLRQIDGSWKRDN